MVRALAGPGSIPARCHMWVEFVVCFRLAPMVFLCVLRFSSFHKNEHLQIPIRTGKPAKADVASSLNICFNYFYESRYFSLVILSLKGTQHSHCSAY